MKPKETLAVLRTFDRQWDAAKRKHDIQPVCYRGCSACCSEPCYTSLDEAELIVSKIPAAERAGVVERTQDWAQQAESSGILQVGTPHVLHYLNVELTCPLLKNDLCLVYAARPLACRSHCAVGASSALCELDRMSQEFAKAPELILHAARRMMREGDHLGVWLAKLLLKSPLESAARVSERQVQDMAESILKVADSLAEAAAQCRKIADGFKNV